MTLLAALAAIALMMTVPGCMEGPGRGRPEHVRLDTLRCAVRDPHTGIVRVYDYVIRVSEEGRALPYAASDEQ